MEVESHLGEDNGAHHVVGLPHFGPPESPVSESYDEVDPAAHEVGDRARSLIGKTKDGKPVWYDPDMPGHRLANEHLAITGETGSGKSQSMKTIIADLYERGVPALVLDFKDDYSDPHYAAKEHFGVFDPTRAPLPLNPLVPPVDPETGMVNTTFHSYQLSDIIGRIYHLGDLQAYNLREAIQGAYQDAGIPAGAFKPAVDQAWPQFQAVKVKLGEPRGKDKSPNGELIGHMSPIFDFGLFSSPDARSFAAIANANTVIRLGQLPGNEVKNSVAEFFLMALYNHLIRQPQSHSLSHVLVLDEAWRVANSPFLEPLMREGRAFGLGIFVATQFPTDLPTVVSGNAASQLFFSQSDPTQVTEVERIMAGHRDDAVGDAVRGLLPLQALLHNKQYAPYAKFDAKPYFAREFKVAHGEEEIDLALHELGVPGDGYPAPVANAYDALIGIPGNLNMSKHAAPGYQPDGGGMRGQRGDWWKYPSMNTNYLDNRAPQPRSLQDINDAREYQGITPWEDKEEMLDTFHLRRVPKKVPTDQNTKTSQSWRGRDPDAEGERGFICTHCQETTDNSDHVCDDCKRTIATFQDTDSSSSGIQERIDSASAGSFPDYGWRVAEIIPFPPGREGSDADDDWLPPFNEMYVHEQFVQSPRNRRRVSRENELVQCPDCGGKGGWGGAVCDRCVGSGLTTKLVPCEGCKKGLDEEKGEVFWTDDGGELCNDCYQGTLDFKDHFGSKAGVTGARYVNSWADHIERVHKLLQQRGIPSDPSPSTLPYISISHPSVEYGKCSECNGTGSIEIRRGDGSTFEHFCDSCVGSGLANQGKSYSFGTASGPWGVSDDATGTSEDWEDVPEESEPKVVADRIERYYRARHPVE